MKVPYPTISIAMCTYNGERHLAEQIDSLLAQDWPNLEIVIVDDGSTDNTRDILQNFASRDDRVRLFFNEKNLGFLANFEKAFSLTTGEFIAPCDQDDWWDPRKLSTLYEAIGENALVYCDSNFMDSNGKLTGKKVSQKINMCEGKNPFYFVFSNCISGHAMLMKRALLEKSLPFPRNFFHDWWLAFIAASTDGVSYVPNALVNYRQHENAQTNLSGEARKPKVKRTRQQGLEKRDAWLELLSTVKSTHQGDFQQLYSASQEWKNSWFSPNFAKLIWKHKHSLFYIDHRASRHHIKRVIRYFVGLKSKHLLNPKRYPLDNTP